ncbi:MAG: hypothetical protein IPK95_03340 [Cellvibrionales bacterium]|nr:hypothetical protein [Cellvibrionales bacterium]
MKNLGALSKQQKTLMTAVVLMVIAVAVTVVGLLPRFVDQANDKKILEAVNILALEQAQKLNGNIEQLQSALAAQIKAAGVVDVLQQGNVESYQMAADKVQLASADLGCSRAPHTLWSQLFFNGFAVFPAGSAGYGRAGSGCVPRSF